MRPSKRKSKHAVMRLPVGLLAILRARADRLEHYLSERASLKQSEQVYLPGGRRENGKIPPWVVVARLLNSVQQLEECERKTNRKN